MFKLIRTISGCYLGRVNPLAPSQLDEPVMIDFIPMQVPGKLHGQVGFVLGRTMTPWPGKRLTINLNHVVASTEFNDDDKSDLIEAYRAAIAESKLTRPTLVK